MAATVNMTTSMRTSSNGAWQGDNPLHFAFPLLLLQTIVVLLLSRALALLLKPLRQPNVIAEIVAGILLGPSAMSRIPAFSAHLFPDWSLPVLHSSASLGLLFFLFLVGLELDLASIRRAGRRAAAIAAAGISLPFASAVGVAAALRRAIPGAADVPYPPFLVFMGVALSITAFPVLARILAELKLLRTRVGETAMAAAAFNDVAAWILLALAVALSGDVPGGARKSPLISLYVLLSGLAFVGFVMLAVRPVMAWLGKRSWGDGEAYVSLTLAAVLASGFATDAIGIHAIFGAFVFGLAIPKEGEFAEKLIEKIEDFVSGLLLPLYFASSGLKTNVAEISGGVAWGLLAMVVATACVGKIAGTFLVAVLHRMPAREALALGVLMNTKGLVELIVLNIGKERKVLNDETFAILVLMALFTTFITTPTLIAIYKPARSPLPYYNRNLSSISTAAAADDHDKAAGHDQLRIMACVHGLSNVPAVINLVDTITGGRNRSPLKLYIMHLVQLTERSSSIVMALRFRRDGLPHRASHRRLRREVAIAFDAYGQLTAGRVAVRALTAVSALPTMHQDICDVAEGKRVAMVLLPFHKRLGSGEADMENVGPGWRAVAQRVLRTAPCSVGVLIDRGLGWTAAGGGRRVCVMFFGGPDDREAMEVAGRMAEHPGVAVTVVRFVNEKGPDYNSVRLRPSPGKCSEESYSFSTAVVDRRREEELDEEAILEFKNKTEGVGSFEEKVARNIEGSVAEIGRSKDYDLIVVGRGRFPSTMVAALAERTAEHAELGPIGDILASAGHGMHSSVLVVQQHDVVHSDVVPVSKVVKGDNGSSSSSNVA